MRSTTLFRVLLTFIEYNSITKLQPCLTLVANKILETHKKDDRNFDRYCHIMLLLIESGIILDPAIHVQLKALEIIFEHQACMVSIITGSSDNSILEELKIRLQVAISLRLKQPCGMPSHKGMKK